MRQCLWGQSGSWHGRRLRPGCRPGPTPEVNPDERASACARQRPPSPIASHFSRRLSAELAAWAHARPRGSGSKSGRAGERVGAPPAPAFPNRLPPNGGAKRPCAIPGISDYEFGAGPSSLPCALRPLASCGFLLLVTCVPQVRFESSLTNGWMRQYRHTVV
jgi:hypothetical protein